MSTYTPDQVDSNWKLEIGCCQEAVDNNWVEFTTQPDGSVLITENAAANRYGPRKFNYGTADAKIRRSFHGRI